MELAFGPGTILFGKYRVENVIGRGGMGMVLRVTHLHLGEELAIKVLSSDGVASPELAARFLREAQAAARLRGEHIARVVDVGVLPEGPPYMVMEYLRGADLARQLGQRKVLPPGETVDYVLQACEALAEAHAQGIIHRDIKPANLFLTTRPDGSPMIKVLDFGISKAPVANHALTRTDVVMGTAGYMSPEQMKAARDVDARSDIWALGVVLYECLCGQPPFYGESFSAVVLMAGTEPPPPMDPRIPRGLQSTVLRCLEKDRKARFPSIAALAAALAPFARDARTAAMIVERANSMVPHDMKVRGVTPVAAPSRQEPTTVHQLGQVTGARAKVSSTRRWVIGGVMALVAVFAGAGILGTRPEHADSKLPAPSPEPVEKMSAIVVLDAAIAEPQHAVVVPDAAIVEPQRAVVVPDAAIATPPATQASNDQNQPLIASARKKHDECLALKSAKRWQLLLDCGKALSQLGQAKGDDFQHLGLVEANNERVAAEIRQQIATGALKDAQTALKTFPTDSVYWSDLKGAFDRADAKNVKDVIAVIASYVSRRDCTGLLVYSLGEAGTEWALDAVTAARAKCTTEVGDTQRPLPKAQVPSVPSLSAKIGSKCDQVDDWVTVAINQYNNGYAQAALALISKALTCKSEVRLYRLAALYACAAHDSAAAKIYFSKIPALFQPAIQQKCQQEHTDLGLPAQ